MNDYKYNNIDEYNVRAFTLEYYNNKKEVGYNGRK